MGRRYPGNLITRTPTALSSSTQYQSSAASGMWSVNTHAFYRKLNYWPTYGVLQPLAYDSTVRFQFDRTASGIKAIDTQGYDQTVTYNGDVTRAGGSYYSDGYNGWALGTNGNSYAYYNYYDTSAIGTGDFTLEGWIKPDTTLAERFFFYVGDYSGNYVGVCTDNSRNLFARSSDNSYITSGFGLSIGVAQNTWRHVALERWEGSIRTYVNEIGRAHV